MKLDTTRPPADGRHFDTELASYAGEAAQIEARDLDDRALTRTPPRGVAAPAAPGEALPTYYDVPLLKPPVWKWYIPMYFYTGGVTGASLALGAAAQLAGGRRMRRLVRACRALGVGGAALSTALLVADLGRPGRFIYMLRVLRPTSPMNVGAWILAATGTASGAAVVLPRSAGELAAIVAGVLGLPLSGYTAVLIAGTAVPAWQLARRSLPPLFTAGAMSGAASLLAFVPLPPAARRAVRVLAGAARAVELLSGRVVEHDLARAPRSRRALDEGRAGLWWRTSKLCTVAALACEALLGRSRGARFAAGALGTAGAVALRFAVAEAGKASTIDPRATTEQQRLGYGGRATGGERARATGQPATGNRQPGNGGRAGPAGG